MVSFPEAMKLFFVNYFKFSGRATRAEYWWPVLAFGAIIGLLNAIARALVPANANVENGLTGDYAIALIIAGISGLIGLATFIPTLAVAFRRVHDTNHSGIWVIGNLLISVFLAPVAVFIMFVIPLIGLFIAGILILLSLAVNITLFVFTLLPGTPGPNIYGSPSGPGLEVIVSTGVAAYRPAMPAPVFDTSGYEMDASNGRFAPNKEPERPAMPSMPNLYHRAGGSADIPLPAPSFGGNNAGGMPAFPGVQPDAEQQNYYAEQGTPFVDPDAQQNYAPVSPEPTVVEEEYDDEPLAVEYVEPEPVIETPAPAQVVEDEDDEILPLFGFDPTTEEKEETVEVVEEPATLTAPASSFPAAPVEDNEPSLPTFPTAPQQPGEEKPGLPSFPAIPNQEPAAPKAPPPPPKIGGTPPPPPPTFR